jgi:hypothetical protein
MKGVPAMAKRALEYVRAHWQADATLTQIELTPDDSPSAIGPPTITAKLDFYSAKAESVLFLSFDAGKLSMLSARAGDTRYDALPEAFADLPDAMSRARQQGPLGNQLIKATLQFLVRENGNDGQTRTVPKTGPYWTLISNVPDLDPEAEPYPPVWAGVP